MTNRMPVSATQNAWFDSEQVDDKDLTLEQNYNNTIQSGMAHNHFGTGILISDLSTNVIFDTESYIGILDGTVIIPTVQPKDSSLGNFLKVELKNSTASGNRKVKVGIIGLNYENNIQYDTFYFSKNEDQITNKHYTKVLAVLFNDLSGDPVKSFNLGGQVVISDAMPAEISRDVLTLKQDNCPNLFFKNFFTDSGTNIIDELKTALPYYNIDSLNINLTSDYKVLAATDITTQIGQKFISKSNNIQKITLLLGAQNLIIGSETDLQWTGDLIVSIYPLQTNISCPSDLVPGSAIEYDPSNIPLAQLSYSYNTLADIGYQLANEPQPIDFVFSNSSLAAGNVIKENTYYVVTIKRSGLADKCDLLISSGPNEDITNRLSIFTGNLWTDLSDQTLWCKIYSDSVKITDCLGYDLGKGIEVPKTKYNQLLGLTEDYLLGNIKFTGNNKYKAVLFADVEKSNKVQDQRTGEFVLSRQTTKGSVKLLNEIEFDATSSEDSLILGEVFDSNRKFVESGLNSNITTNLYSATLVKDYLLVKIIDDVTDPRYDVSVYNLISNFTSGELVNAKLYPNSSSINDYYRVADAELLTMKLGDVDGDGIVTKDDLTELTTWKGVNLNQFPPASTVYFTNGIIATATNGYDTVTNPFVNQTGVNFQVVRSDDTIEFANVDGQIVADPNDGRLAQLTSAAASFSSIIANLYDYSIILYNPSTQENYGKFEIVSYDVSSDTVTIRKDLLTPDNILKLLRSDVDEDMVISDADEFLVANYLARKSTVVPMPKVGYGPTTPAYSKIGTEFKVLKLRLESFIDRHDDYLINPRSTSLHPIQDVFKNDSFFDALDGYATPSEIRINKQLTWNEEFISCVNNSKKVLVALDGPNTKMPEEPGVKVDEYPIENPLQLLENNIFIPNDLVLNGSILSKDGLYKQDFEIATINLEVPSSSDGYERSINLFQNFVADSNAGTTAKGYRALKFADNTFVTLDALSLNQVRFNISLQAFSPNLSGTDINGISGIVIDGKVGVYIDYNTGLLKLNFTNLYKDSVLTTLSTKVQVTVFLKKAGFNNNNLYVSSEEVENMLSL
jgi:hypothetical protein